MELHTGWGTANTLHARQATSILPLLRRFPF